MTIKEFVNQVPVMAGVRIMVMGYGLNGQVLGQNEFRAYDMSSLRAQVENMNKQLNVASICPDGEMLQIILTT